jgi:transcriptional regulator with XRE-family HTH domain
VTFKSWMASKNLTAAAVARGAGIPPNTISRFLSGANALSPENIAKLVDFAGGEVSFSDLIREGERRRKVRRAAKVEATDSVP